MSDSVIKALDMIRKIAAGYPSNLLHAYLPKKGYKGVRKPFI